MATRSSTPLIQNVNDRPTIAHGETSAGLAFQVITACFRVQRWSLKITTGRLKSRDGHRLDARPGCWAEAHGCGARANASAVLPHPLGPAWAPDQVQAPANDALFPGEWNLDFNQEYTTMAKGSALASHIRHGNLFLCGTGFCGPLRKESRACRARSVCILPSRGP